MIDLVAMRQPLVLTSSAARAHAAIAFAGESLLVPAPASDGGPEK